MVLSPVSGNITSPSVYVVFVAPAPVLAKNECGCHGSIVLFLCGEHGWLSPTCDTDNMAPKCSTQIYLYNLPAAGEAGEQVRPHGSSCAELTLRGGQWARRDVTLPLLLGQQKRLYSCATE